MCFFFFFLFYLFIYFFKNIFLILVLKFTRIIYVMETWSEFLNNNVKNEAKIAPEST